MVTIWYLDFQNSMGLVVDGEKPVVIPEEEAWAFIEETMKKPERPKFMWVEPYE